MSGFEAMLDEVLQERVGGVSHGLEQRLMARFAQETEREALRVTEAKRERRLFGLRVEEQGWTKRIAASMWAAIVLHAVVMLAIGLAYMRRESTVLRETELMTLVTPHRAVPVMTPRIGQAGGGGGQRDLAPAAQGHLPNSAHETIVPPKAPPTMAAKLQVEPTVDLPKDLTMADNTMPNLGLPSSTVRGISMGQGSGLGIGSGEGDGIGPGVGGGVGGGVVAAGSVERGPKLIHQVDPEFSDEARRAKFSGDVQVYVVVDEKGMPTHVRVARGAGMGLDEKAVEAVRQYRFTPAMQGGKAVKVYLYIDVRFDVL